jgi:hypothetical protein
MFEFIGAFELVSRTSFGLLLDLSKEVIEAATRWGHAEKKLFDQNSASGFV